MWVVFKFYHVLLSSGILISTLLSERFGGSSSPDCGSVKDGCLMRREEVSHGTDQV